MGFVCRADSIKDVSKCHISPRRRLELPQLRARSMAWWCQWWHVSTHIKSSYRTRWIFTFSGRKWSAKCKFNFEKVVVEVEVVSTCISWVVSWDKACELAATKLCPVPGCHETDAGNDIKTSTHHQTHWRSGWATFSSRNRITQAWKTWCLMHLMENIYAL